MRDDVSAAQARNFLVALYAYVGELTYKVDRAERALSNIASDRDAQREHQMITEWRTDMHAAHEVIAQLHRQYPDTHALPWTAGDQQPVGTATEQRQSRRRAGR